jgi:hypothetical protein
MHYFLVPVKAYVDRTDLVPRFLPGASAPSLHMERSNARFPMDPWRKRLRHGSACRLNFSALPSFVRFERGLDVPDRDSQYRVSVVEIMNETTFSRGADATFVTKFNV